MWVLERLTPQPALAVQTSLRLDGSLDLSALRATLAWLVERHEALRTHFEPAGGRLPPAVVEPSPELPLELVDLAALPRPEQEAAIRRCGRESVRRPFDLTKAPLMRVTLFVLGPEGHHLLLLAHHTVADGRSSAVLAEELATAYGALASGAAPPLPAVACTSGQHAAAERERLSPDAISELVGWWRTYLAGAPPRLELPTDRPRPAVQRHEGGRTSIVLPGSLCEQGDGAGATRFHTLLAAWTVVLSRHSGGDDLVLGTHVAGRDRPGTERTVGCLMNTVPLRVDLTGGPSFGELLLRVAGSVDGALEHAELPFEVLVDRLRPSRDTSANPVFQSEYVWWGTPDLRTTRAGVDFTLSPLDLGACATDLGLTVSPSGDDLLCRLDYDLDLFEPATGERMLRHLQAVLEGAAAHPDAPVASLPLLDDEERHRLLVTWNDTASPLPVGTVLDLIGARAGQHPEEPAVVSGEDRLTYGQLDEAAGALALALRDRGVGHGQLVGVSVSRPVDVVVAQLAVLLAGAAFVPIDPEAPAARREALRDSAGLAAVLTEADLVPDRGGPGLREVRDHEGPQPDDLAYVVHTSGSTSLPKGVMVTHANLLASTWAHLLRHPEPMGAFLLTHAPGFDAYVGNVVWALAAGGTLVLPSPGDRGDPDHLLGLVARHGPTHAICLSTLWSLVLRRADEGELECLRTVVIGSEQCPRGLVGRHAAALPGAALHNEYGPTECTMWSTAHRCGADEPRWPVPVGRPIANAKAYVLDSRREPVPVGVAGELHIGGSGVGRGYLGQPELTEERFVPDPFDGRTGARMYRTGDRARWLPDGVLQVLGRLDDQVKIRGYRVEPGEVEAALRGHSEVVDAVAGAREGPDGSARLVAWVVPSSATVEVEELRRYCRAELPTHLVPSLLAVVGELPRTAAGKVDRRALPDPAVSAVDDPLGRSPATPTERRLAALWEELLEVPPVRATDNFFDLGGHSLLALQLFVAIEEELGFDLPLATLFRAPTVEALAAELDAGGEAGWSSRVEIKGGDGGLPFFCVHGAAGNVLVFHELASRLGSDRPFHALQSPGLDGSRFPFRCIEDMAAHYVEELRAEQPGGPWLLGGYSFGGIVAYEMAQQLVAAGGEVGILALLDTVGPDWRERSAAGGARRLVERLRAEARLALGRPLPITLRSLYLKGATRRMRTRYAPRPYPGPITLFCRPEDRAVAEARWSPLARGGLGVQVVEATHDTMLEWPAVDLVAVRLRDLLAAADRCSTMVVHDA